MKAIPLLLISLPPFANYLVFVLMWVPYLTPYSSEYYIITYIVLDLPFCPCWHPFSPPIYLPLPPLFTARYFFPRQLLIRHFWSPRQQAEFQGLYHSLRVQHHQPVLKGLENKSRQVKDTQLQSRLKGLCAKVSDWLTLSDIFAHRNMMMWIYLTAKYMTKYYLPYAMYWNNA